MAANDIQIGGAHYTAEYQHWDLVADFQLDYYRANATKYMTRHRAKNGLQDVQKAGHYIDKLMELIEQRRMPSPCELPHRIHIAMIKLANDFYIANKIEDQHDREFMDSVLLAQSFADLATAKSVLKKIEAKYPQPTDIKLRDVAPASVPATAAIGGVLLNKLVSETGGRYQPSAQFTLEGYKGNRDCWQCRKCFAHFELPADTNPETAHKCDSGDDGTGATKFYVDQARDDRLASQA